MPLMVIVVAMEFISLRDEQPRPRGRSARCRVGAAQRSIASGRPIAFRHALRARDRGIGAASGHAQGKRRQKRDEATATLDHRDFHIPHVTRLQT